jgi:glycyl-tRNA synthetase
LAAALQRARRIAPGQTSTSYDAAALTEPAERRLHEAVTTVRSSLPGSVDLGALVAAAGDLPTAVDTFFDDIMVMADDPGQRSRRLALVASVASLGDGILDWEQLRV